MSTKSNALQALLGANTNVTKNVAIKRLGVNFTVKALVSAEVEQARKECTFGNTVREELVEATLIAKACVEPNFADRSLIDHYEAEDAADCVRKALLAGEIVRIMTAINEVSGFNDDGAIDFPNS